MDEVAALPVDHRGAAPDKVELSVQIDRELLNQVNHLTSDPAKVIEVALRQWLRGDRRPEEDLVRHLPRNPTVPPKGEWND
ncbi:MAG: hypothetical protein VKL98_05725 [Cyanobacteriota bacterium]|nr:hypothetical protein [Cyanobacteriota bacterium]